MAGVTITLLGGFGADVDGEPVPEKAWRLKKARELVKLLALAPDRRLHREQVMDVLWRDRGPAQAEAHIEWARDAIAAASDASTGRAYVNYLGDAGEARSSYSDETYTRLVALKNEYDPTNVFRLNQNIEPQAS